MDLSPTPLSRIYFDTNDGTPKLYGLGLTKSADDLAKIPGGPKSGMTVTIYMTGELEMEAILEWNESWDGWAARPVDGTLRNNHEKWIRGYA